MLTVNDLITFVGDRSSVPDTAYATQCWAEAQALVTVALGASASLVPEPILDRATLEVGSELYHRRNAPNGISQFATTDGAPIRVARDPMVGAWPLLKPYMIGIG